MARFDRNEDGQLDAEEIRNAPVLRRSYVQIDADQDGKITAAEIADRVQAWHDSTARMMKATATIYLGSEPLAGATVTLDPVPYLNPNYPTATAVTDDRGTARFTGQDRRYPGIYVGLYAVRVSKLVDGQETIPARYNTESELFYEVSQEQWTNMLFNVYSLEAE